VHLGQLATETLANQLHEVEPPPDADVHDVEQMVSGGLVRLALRSLGRRA
jgi:hypothetical protein